ncbi:MAG: isoprenylcysteine carboxylmethyltransferase family protein [Anaerolineales bacterium]|nr:isoprenylcysteine carboxylmethyltransferase family protein [Anaerolineales bacterium]
MSIDQLRSKRKPILPPTYLLIALSVMLGLHFIYPGFSVIPTPWKLFGLLFLGIGIGISYAAEAQFHRANTAVKPFEEPAALVTDGMFRFSRNPMYLGFVSILFGAAISLGSLTPTLAIPVFIALIHKKFVRVEEQLLAKTFPREWLDYAKKVRCWL